MSRLSVKPGEIEAGDVVTVEVADVKAGKSGVRVITADGLVLTLPADLDVSVRRSARTPPGPGGPKGEAVRDTLRRARKPLTAGEVAEKAGCSIGRVYEVARACEDVVWVERGRLGLAQ